MSNANVLNANVVAFGRTLGNDVVVCASMGISRAIRIISLHAHVSLRSVHASWRRASRQLAEVKRLAQELATAMDQTATATAYALLGMVQAATARPVAYPACPRFRGASFGPAAGAVLRIPRG